MGDKTIKMQTELLKAIKTKIKLEGWSMAEAGKRAKTHRTHMNNIINDTENGVSLKKLINVANGLGLKVDLVITDRTKKGANLEMDF